MTTVPAGPTNGDVRTAINTKFDSLDAQIAANTTAISTNTTRLGEITINAKASPYGADATGVADAAGAIQAALDAAQAAGGGTVLLPTGVYRLSTALKLADTVRLIGVGRTGTSTLRYYGTGAAIQKQTPLANVARHVEIAHLLITNTGGSGTIGVDMRGFTRSHLHDLWITGFTSYGIYWGGDYSTYNAGYSNLCERVTIELCPTCMYWNGVTAGGATTANYITVRNCILTPSGTSGIACDVYGDSAYFFNNDISYNVDAIGIQFRSGAVYSAVIANRFEGIGISVGKYPITLASGASYNYFAGNEYSLTAQVPCINDADQTNNRTVILDTRMRTSEFSTGALDLASDIVIRRALSPRVAAGTLFIDSKATGESNRSFGITGRGGMIWYNPASGAVNGGLQINSTSTGVMQWMDNTYLAVAKVAALPTAAAAYRGVMLRVEGGTGVADHLYVCIKNAADAYAWQQIV